MFKIIAGAAETTKQSVHKTTHYEKLTQEPSDEEVEDDVVFLQEGAAFHRNGFAAADIRNHIQNVDEEALAGLLQKGSVSSKRPVGTDFIEVKMARLRCCRKFLSRRCVALMLFTVLIILAVALITIILSSYRLPHLVKPTSEWVKEYSAYSMFNNAILYLICFSQLILFESGYVTVGKLFLNV